DLITTSPYKHWNPVALQSYLCDEDQRLVSQIYLSQTEKEDKLIWSHTRDGNYTNRLSTTTFTFVKRNGNQAAHEIVRHGPANSIFENCKVYPPKWLTPTLYSDIMLSY
ncbi:hypothetical protein HID58_026701, partial [Brassica napus]